MVVIERELLLTSSWEPCLFEFRFLFMRWRISEQDHVKMLLTGWRCFLLCLWRRPLPLRASQLETHACRANCWVQRNKWRQSWWRRLSGCPARPYCIRRYSMISDDIECPLAFLHSAAMGTSLDQETATHFRTGSRQDAAHRMAVLRALLVGGHFPDT